MQKTLEMIETLAHRYASKSTQWELSNEYQHDSVQMVSNIIMSLCFKKTKITSPLEGSMFAYEKHL